MYNDESAKLNPFSGFLITFIVAMRNIHFFFQSPLPTLRERTALKAFLIKQSRRLGRPIHTLNIIFCSDPYLISINQQFLQHNEYTDIITFDLSNSSTQPLHAEIYISIDRVRDNAKQLAVSFKQELHRVIFHGTLHLMGYKDKKKSDIALMRSMEDRLLTAYFT